MTQKIAVTGYKGRLGSELVKRGLLPLDCDITSKISIKAALRDVMPDIVIHCAAMTDVDACEENKDEALEINAKGTENLKVCFEGKIIYISTDYVFDGKKGMYHEYDKPPDPACLCWYGYTKLLGEQLLGSWDVIVRTTMLYGAPGKTDFVTHILNRLDIGDYFSVTKALHGTPTYIPHLADGIMELLYRQFSPHIIHIAGGDLLSRYDFALIIASVFGYDALKFKIVPTNKIGKVKRPRHAGLNTRKATLINIPIHSVTEGLEALRDSDVKFYKQLRMSI